MFLFANKLDALKNAINSNLPGELAHGLFSPPGRINYKEALLLNEKPQKAAVLIPLYLNEKSEPTILLTLRKTYPGVHSGQISFPGGKFEQYENSAITVALREAKEEVGISPENVSIIGELSPLYIPPSHIVVFPVIGYLQKTEPWNIQEREVEKSIEIGISDFLNPNNRMESDINIGNQIRKVPSYNINGIVVWGATAMIISEFLYIWKGILSND
jgi:8-oxo-dGTP pyrophosphatase MutT (NUDIX family)